MVALVVALVSLWWSQKCSARKEVDAGSGAGGVCSSNKTKSNPKIINSLHKLLLIHLK